MKNGTMTRRDMLVGAAAASAFAIVRPRQSVRADTVPVLRPQSSNVALLGGDEPTTPVWCYNGMVPGPELRLRQGDRLRVDVENRLGQETTVHWHGLRLPNVMDGVPGLTQPPIEPGRTFRYEFALPDAGTFWYHPHVRSSEQQGRGLYGALIVEEPDPPQVDRDVTWVIDDWRLGEDGAISDTFGHPMDLSHAGRLGNVATLNGRDSKSFAVRAGERIRLRLINTANARIFALTFEDHDPVVIALDGQPCTPHAPEGNRVILPPAGRADLILDLVGSPGKRYTVKDDYYARQTYRFLELAYRPETPLRESFDPVTPLAPNPIPEPRLKDAQRHDIVLAGGAMGGMRSAILDGKEMGLREMAGQGKMWAVNGIAAHATVMKPLFVFTRDRTQVLTMRNDTAFPHPMHLHGHSFRLMSRNGKPVAGTPWLDTVLVEPRETVEVAFVADNPGDWLLHCHVLEHMQAGMSAVVRVV